jgi:DNA-binding transcriptional ArsR family regulator
LYIIIIIEVKKVLEVFLLKIVNEFSPIYEIVNSLFVFSAKNNFHDFGKEWTKEVIVNIDDADFLIKIQGSDSFPSLDYIYLLILNSPEKNDVSKFIHWLENLTAGEVYEILSPYVVEGLPGNLGEIRDDYVYLLKTWLRYYKINDSVFNSLAEKAKLVESTMHQYELTMLIEQLTNGIHVIPTEQTNIVVLIPSYYLKPMNYVACLHNTAIVVYSVDFPMENTVTPPLALSRMTRALGDEKRLQILKILAEKPYNLTDLSKEIKLSKSNLHYHLSLLRIAGLVRAVKDLSIKFDKYEIRPNVFIQLKDLLEQYILGKMK